MEQRRGGRGLQGSHFGSACRLLAILAALAVTASAGLAQQLRILTSMPPSLTDPFIAAFRQEFPQAEVLVLNKNTNSAHGRDHAWQCQRGFDIFWASSPEAFALIAEHDGFDASACPALPMPRGMPALRCLRSAGRGGHMRAHHAGRLG
jgi:hypothetical protein